MGACGNLAASRLGEVLLFDVPLPLVSREVLLHTRDSQLLRVTETPETEPGCGEGLVVGERVALIG